MKKFGMQYFCEKSGMKSFIVEEGKHGCANIDV
jgi:hypothetical protein